MGSARRHKVRIIGPLVRVRQGYRPCRPQGHGGAGSRATAVPAQGHGHAGIRWTGTKEMGRIGGMNASAAADAAEESSELFDYERFEARVEELAKQYGANRPYPHLRFEEFLKPAAAEEIARVFPTESDSHWI